MAIPPLKFSWDWLQQTSGRLCILLHALGGEGLDALDIAQDERATAEDILDAFRTYCSPKKNTVFFKRCQFWPYPIAESITIEKYVTELRQKRIDWIWTVSWHDLRQNCAQRVRPATQRETFKRTKLDIRKSHRHMSCCWDCSGSNSSDGYSKPANINKDKKTVNTGVKQQTIECMQ